MLRRDASSLDSQIYFQFTGTSEQFEVLGTDVGAATTLGVATRTGRPMRIELLRPRPVRIVVVAQAWLAVSLAVRAALLGATTVIATERPTAWQRIVRAGGGTQPFASIVGPDVTALPHATAANPLFVLHDAVTTAETALARAPWHTSLHLVYNVASHATSAPDTPSALHGADLLLLPRLPEQDISAALELLRLPSSLAMQLPMMTEHQFLAITARAATMVTVTPTPSELSLLQGA